MAKAFWKGAISFGMVAIPIRVSVATEHKMPGFHYLHKKCLTRPKQVWYCPADDEYIGLKDMDRGVEYTKGQYLFLDETDFKKENWLLIKHKAGDTVTDSPASPSLSLDGVSLADLVGKRRAPLPSSYSPMLATPASSPPSNKNARWSWEPKLDGYRIVALIRNGKAVLLSRNALDVTDSYPDVARQLAAQNASTLALDGEIVAMDEKGRPCFQCLQHLSERSASRNGTATPVVYYVFDVLHVDGYEVLQVPLQRRKKLLAATLKTSDAVRFVEYFTGAWTGSLSVRRRYRIRRHRGQNARQYL